MAFTGFADSDFAAFHIEGLEARMDAIRTRIQPKFIELGDSLCDDVAMAAGSEMFVHIAKHLRRKINPPKDTWMAFAGSKRGYKQHPHFQIGLFDDHVFLWFALIYELPEKKKIAADFIKNIDTVRQTIPSGYAISFDHMKKDALKAGDLSKAELRKALERFRDVQKVELLVGRHLLADDPVLKDGSAFIGLAKETFETLMPLYRLSLN
ncbi:YktB family protein [Paenibacillus sp. MBLB4367]|uniref:YktB family protein n=1 Tax=Paenibacillus sp. MBLB4367 TaxID=3384767 RepID=UPI0039083518